MITIGNDEAFEKRVVEQCAEEVFKIRKPSAVKKVSAVMKKYEDQIYERYIKKTPVNTLDKRNERQDVSNAAVSGVKFPFVGDASFLTNYDRMLRGYKDESTFNQQELQLPYEVKVKMPSDMGTYQPKNQFSEHKNYVDTHANSKHYFPQDHEPHFNNMNIYNNKPIGDISNQQNLFMSQLDKAGMLDPYSQQNYGSPTLPPNSRGQAGLSNSQFMRSNATPYQNDFGRQTNSLFSPPFTSPINTQSNIPPMNPSMNQQMNPQMPQIGSLMGQQMNPQFNQEEYKLRRNIELLGGIERTIPNMERSLRDNEFKNVEQNYNFQSYPDNTSNMRLNNLMQNQMTNVYSPQFDAPNARSSSPIRGGHPDVQRPNVYFSPSKSPYPQEMETRQNNFTRDNFTRDNFGRDNFGRDNFSRDILSEKSINTPYRPNFSSSKSLRGEKAEVLNVQYNIPANYGHVEGQE